MLRHAMHGNASNLSQHLWHLDWRTHLPVTVADGVRLEPATTADITAFVAAHYATIFAADPGDRRFLAEPPSEAKARFLELSDKLLFRDGDDVIGILVGNPVDWSTYYWRTVAFLPEHQGRGLLATALAHTDELMRNAGIARIEGDAAPANYRQVRLLLRLGYCITGSTNSERWGSILRLTRFLHPEGHRVFTTQFCKDPNLPGPSGPDQLKKEGGHHEEVCTRHVLIVPPSLQPARVQQ